MPREKRSTVQQQQQEEEGKEIPSALPLPTIDESGRDIRHSFLGTLDHFPCDLIRTLWVIQSLNIDLKSGNNISSKRRAFIKENLLSKSRDLTGLVDLQLARLREQRAGLLFERDVRKRYRNEVYDREYTAHRTVSIEDPDLDDVREKEKEKKKGKLLELKGEKVEKKRKKKLVVKIKGSRGLKLRINLKELEQEKSKKWQNENENETETEPKEPERGQVAEQESKLLGTNYSKGKQGEKLNEAAAAGSAVAKAAEAVEEELFCTCRNISYGQMIACDNERCPIEWFHYGCVGLTETPRGKWYCSLSCKRQAQAF